MGQGVARYYERIEPLLGSPKLGPVVWQLPPNFHRDDERLAGALDALPEGRHCFEFRHESWFADEVYELLRSHGAALVIGDTPRAPVPDARDDRRLDARSASTAASAAGAATTRPRSCRHGRAGSRSGAGGSRSSPTSTTTGRASRPATRLTLARSLGIEGKG